MIQMFKRYYKEAFAQRAQVALPNLKKPIVLLTIGTMVYLALASIFSGVAFNLSRARIDFSRFFLLLATVGFAFLFLDELIGFHEMTGRWLDPSVGVPDGFRTWNDIVVILYEIVPRN